MPKPPPLTIVGVFGNRVVANPAFHTVYRHDDTAPLVRPQI
jgi:hypothetical protein